MDYFSNYGTSSKYYDIYNKNFKVNEYLRFMKFSQIFNYKVESDLHYYNILKSVEYKEYFYISRYENEKIEDIYNIINQLHHM